MFPSQRKASNKLLDNVARKTFFEMKMLQEKEKKRERQDVSSFSLGLKLIGPGLEKYYQNTHTHTISTKPSTGLVAMAIMLCNSAYRKGGGV